MYKKTSGIQTRWIGYKGLIWNTEFGEQISLFVTNYIEQVPHCAMLRSVIFPSQFQSNQNVDILSTECAKVSHRYAQNSCSAKNILLYILKHKCKSSTPSVWNVALAVSVLKNWTIFTCEYTSSVPQGLHFALLLGLFPADFHGRLAEHWAFQISLPNVLLSRRLLRSLPL